MVDGSFGGDGVGRVRQGAELGEEGDVGGWGAEDGVARAVAMESKPARLVGGLVG